MKTPIRSPSARLLAVQARLEALPRQAITAEQAKAQGTQHLAEAGAGMLKQAAESKQNGRLWRHQPGIAGCPLPAPAS